MSSAISVGAMPYFLTYDGRNVWVSLGSGQLVRIDAVGPGLAQVSATMAGAGFTGMAFDGEALWVAEIGSSSVFRYPL